jgi:hypothetical protein
MKLKLPVIYSQRDPRWASILLGYNTSSQYTIGNYGCLITCLAMEVNKTPDQVNQILKDNNGFSAGGGNFLWAKCTALGLASTYTSYNWSGPVTDAGIAKAKELLDQGYPLLCEVDFNPATTGEEMHFVLAEGYDGDNFFIADPWTGNEQSFDVYGGFKRAVIQFHVYDKVFPKVEAVPDLQTELTNCRFNRDNHWNDLMEVKKHLKIDGEYSLTLILADIDKLIGLEDEMRNKDAQLKQVQQQAQDYSNQLAERTNELTMLKTDYEAFKTSMEKKIADLQKEMTDNATDFTNKMKVKDDQIAGLKIDIDKLKKPLPVFTGWKKKLYDWLVGSK